MDEAARILGLDCHETCTRSSLPKLVIQDALANSRQTRNLVTRSIYSLPVSPESHSFDLSGAFSSSQFAFRGSFRFRDQFKKEQTWNVFSELLPNENFSEAAADSTGAPATAHGYAEGSLLRTIA